MINDADTVTQARPHNPGDLAGTATIHLADQANARQYNLDPATVRKWRNRDTVEDGSHRPHNLRATLSPLQEEIVVELRRSLLFLTRLIKAAPMHITHILTDNGKEFTDRFCATGERTATGEHVFDKTCTAHRIEHRLTKPRHPQTNGMVERFSGQLSGRISEVVASHRFESSQHLHETLHRYVRLYNHDLPQKALGHVPPIQALKQSHEKKPECFSKCPYNLAGLDTYQIA